jgi:hypothetical protein
MNYGALMSQLEGFADSILDVVAKEGLIALKRTLDAAGFADSPHLKDYEISATAGGGIVEFEILVDVDSIDDESKRKMRKENDAVYKKHAKEVKGRSDAKEFVRTYTMSPKGRPQRIAGRRDARRPARDARKFQADAKKIPADRARSDAGKGSGERYVEHEMNATAPRGMDVDRSGKLRIALQREIRNTKKKVIFPKGQYQGIVQTFVDKINDIVASKFVPELEKIIAENLS